MAMKTERLDCRGVAQEFLDWAGRRIAQAPTPPCLALVLNRKRMDPGSLQYRDVLVKDAQRLGVTVRSVEISTPSELEAALSQLNADPAVQGIVVFYPMGFPRRDEDWMDLVSPRKDIEGLHSINLGYLIKYRRYLDEAAGIKCVVPATAKAVVKALAAHPKIAIEGAFVTLINNSMRVGKPLGLMLENLGATVVKCYDRTPKDALEACVRRSDIVVTAVPDPAFKLDASWVKPGAAVLDVSFGGNVDSAALEGRASLATDEGNRLGKVTRAMMFVNLAYCLDYGQENDKETGKKGRISAR